MLARPERKQVLLDRWIVSGDIGEGDVNGGDGGYSAYGGEFRENGAATNMVVTSTAVSMAIPSKRSIIGPSGVQSVTELARWLFLLSSTIKVATLAGVALAACGAGSGERLGIPADGVLVRRDRNNFWVLL